MAFLEFESKFRARRIRLLKTEAYCKVPTSPYALSNLGTLTKEFAEDHKGLLKRGEGVSVTVDVHVDPSGKIIGEFRRDRYGDIDKKYVSYRRNTV